MSSNEGKVYKTMGCPSIKRGPGHRISESYEATTELKDSGAQISFKSADNGTVDIFFEYFGTSDKTYGRNIIITKKDCKKLIKMLIDEIC